MADQFADILNRASGEAARPQTLPRGTYMTVVNGPFRSQKVGQDQTDTVNFNLKIVQVLQVDDAEAAAIEGGLPGKEIFARFFLTEKALYRLDEFLDLLGIPKGTPYKQALAEAPGKSIVVNLGIRPSDDGTKFYNEIKSYARA